MTLITIENDILIATQKLNIIMGVSDETVVVPEDTDIREEKNITYDLSGAGIPIFV
jgi:hypothetical protein